MNKLLLLLIGLLFLSGLNNVSSQPVRIHTSQDSLHVGALFDVYIVFDNPGNFDRIILPDSTSFSEPFEFRNRVRALSRSGSDSVSIRLQFFGTTDTVLTALSAYGIKASDTLRFEIADYPLFFRSLLSDDSEIRPFKPIFEFDTTSLIWLFLLLFIIVVVLIVYFYKKTKSLPEEKPLVVQRAEPEPFIHPLEALKSGISELEKQLLNNSISYDLFYVTAGDLIRIYIQRTHHQAAMEQTTKEVIRDFRGLTTNNRLINLIREILQECDMVKFAKFSPDTSLMMEMVTKLNNYAIIVSEEDATIYNSLLLAYEKKYITTENKGEQE